MTNSNPLFERTHILIGDEGIERLQNSHVFIAGIGGVGSFTAEALARMGVGKLHLQITILFQPQISIDN